MKDKLKTIATIFIALIICVCTFKAKAESESFDASALVYDIINSELEKNECDSVQTWIDNYLSIARGGSSEWYIIALSQMGGYNFSAYESSLWNWLMENEVHSASTKLKYVLSLLSVGTDDSKFIIDFAQDAIGKQGIMSWVYGLHIINNGYTFDGITSENIVEHLLSLQLEDGGWALNGASSDVDVTAMVIQSLAPHFESSGIKPRIEKAIDLLSFRQTENGGFSSYGVENPESSAQVIIALSALGIDCCSDQRFIKNGHTIFDAISEFELSYGEYCHIKGGTANSNATVQVFLSSVAYFRYSEGKGSIYLLDSCSEADNEKDVSSITSIYDEDQMDTSYIELDNDNPDTEEGKIGYKVYLCIVFFCIAVAICIVLAAKKSNIKNILLVIIIMIITVVLILITDIHSANLSRDFDSGSKTSIGNVTITIRCDMIAGMDKHVPVDGIILDTAEYNVFEGTTVYDVLSRAAMENDVHIETNGIGDMLYIQGIGNIYEFDYGDLSGWVYRVNGVQPSESCGEYLLRDGDVIEWIYSCNLGKDIN